MAQPQLNQRLTSMDASFLYFEKKEAPLHIGGIHVFDGEIPFESFREMVAAKLPMLPRYHQKVIPAPFNVGHPTWEFDPDFNINRHIFHLQVEAPGTLNELRLLAERVLMGMLDRGKPLWEIYVISGMDGNRSALVSKVHHAMVDGISGVDLMKVMFDMSPNPKPTPKLEALVAPARSADMTRSFIDGVLGAAEERMNSWNEFQKGLLNMTQTFLKEPTRPLNQTSTNVMSSMAAPVTLMPWNKANSGEQRLGWTEFSFAEARAIRAAIGGTVNDVVLTVLSGAAARYLELHNAKTSGRNLRVMVPVSMRREDQRGALGNLVSVLPVELPLDIKDPLERYSQLSKKTGVLKGAGIAEGINLMTALMGTVPASLQAFVGTLTSTPVPPFNIVCTNVPGPQIPLYVLGQRMTHSYPYIPIGFAVGVSMGILSYDQKLFIGVSGDKNGMPDVDRFMAFLNEAFAELRNAAGVSESKPPVIEAVSAKKKTRAKAHDAKERQVSN